MGELELITWEGVGDQGEQRYFAGALTQKEGEKAKCNYLTILFSIRMTREL